MALNGAALVPDPFDIIAFALFVLVVYIVVNQIATRAVPPRSPSTTSRKQA